MSTLVTLSLPHIVVGHASTRRFGGERQSNLTLPSSRFQRTQSVRCHATQTQSTQRKSSTAIVQRSDPKAKVKEPKLDDGSGGFPPFRFGRGGGGGGGGGGGSNYFGGFLLFSCVLLLDYLKEFEKNMVLQRHRTGDDASKGLLQQ